MPRTDRPGAFKRISWGYEEPIPAVRDTMGIALFYFAIAATLFLIGCFVVYKLYTWRERVLKRRLMEFERAQEEFNAKRTGVPSSKG